jgi:molecular chaperone DnaK
MVILIYGGEDFDNELVKYLTKQFENEYGINIMNNKRSKGRLKRECEKAKIDLSNSKETTIYID